MAVGGHFTGIDDLLDDFIYLPVYLNIFLDSPAFVDVLKGIHSTKGSTDFHFFIDFVFIYFK